MASQTYLQLCQRVRREAEIAGTGPVSVTGNQTLLARLVAWVSDAYEEIQNKSDNWRWLRSEFLFDTVAGTDKYAATDCTDTLLSAPVTRFANWWPLDEDECSNVKRYLKSGGAGQEGHLSYLPWPAFRSIYKIGAQNNGQPAHFTIDPLDNIILGPVPDGVYVVTGEYQKSAQILAVDGDIPEMPARFHNLIAFRALEKYGANSVAQEIYARALVEGDRIMRQLERDQLPNVFIVGPLA